MCDPKNIFNLNSQASSYIQGDLTVTNNAVINGNETIEGDLTVEQTSNLNGNVNIGGDINVTGSLISIKDIQVFGTIYSYGSAEFRYGSLGTGSGTLNVYAPDIDITTNLYYPTTTTATDILTSVS